MKARKIVLVCCLVVIIPLMISTVALAAEVEISLVKTSGYSRIDFDSAYTMIWAGEVKFAGTTIGEYTAKITKTTHTGSNGAITEYDIIIPGGSGAIADFLSIRTNHIVTGSGADFGMVYAASPAFKALVGAAVEMAGDVTTIKW